MSIDRELPNLLWPICCFDRRRDKPLPVYSRWYWLDWQQLTPEQISEILEILDTKKNHESPHSPCGLNETVICISIGLDSSDVQMLKYRHLFMPIPDNDFEAFFNHPDRQNFEFDTVSVSEYFEDETETPITSYEMIKHVSGQEFPIILRDPNSVMRLGAVSPVNGADWTIEKSNTIAQFLDVVQRIHRSNWYRSPHKITSLLHKTEGSKLLEAKFPDDVDIMSVLAYFRQLHAGDKLVVKACEAYIGHVSDNRKQGWVNERKQTFESLVDKPPFGYNTDGKSIREIIRMFMYGARLLHSSSNQGDSSGLDSFISQHGKHKAVMIFNSCLMNIFRVASTIHPVIYQDYHHWINNENFAGANRIAIPDLFCGFMSPPHGV